jgi:hypothetical protein
MKYIFILITWGLIIFSSCTSMVKITCNNDRVIELTEVDLWIKPIKEDYYASLERSNYTPNIKPGQNFSSNFFSDDSFIYVKLGVGYLPLQTATENASKNFIDNIKENSTIAIINIASPNNPDESDLVINLLITIFSNANKFILTDRQSLDLIMAEQKFQLSGEVDDNTIVSIGKMLGANVVITGTIRYVPFSGEIIDIVSGRNLPYSAGTRQLVLKALDVKTGQIVAMSTQS